MNESVCVACVGVCVPVCIFHCAILPSCYRPNSIHYFGYAFYLRTLRLKRNCWFQNNIYLSVRQHFIVCDIYIQFPILDYIWKLLGGRPYRYLCAYVCGEMHFKLSHCAASCGLDDLTNWSQFR